MAKPAGFLRYHVSLVFDAHKISRGHWGSVATWFGYVLAASAAFTSVFEAWKLAHPMLTKWGPLAFVGTLIVATLVRENWQRILQLRQTRATRVKITSKPSLREMGQLLVAVQVRLTNPKAEPVSFEQEWVLTLTTPDGAIIDSLVGSIDGELRPMEHGAIFHVTMSFWGASAKAREATGFVLTGADIWGNVVRAPWPEPNAVRGQA